MMYGPWNLPEGFVSIEELFERWDEAVVLLKRLNGFCGITSFAAATDIGMRTVARDAILDIAEEMAEAGEFICRVNQVDRQPIFVADADAVTG